MHSSNGQFDRVLRTDCKVAICDSQASVIHTFCMMKDREIQSITLSRAELKLFQQFVFGVGYTGTAVNHNL